MNISSSPDLTLQNRADTRTLGSFRETYSSEAIILLSEEVNRQLRESKWIALIFTILVNSISRIWQSMSTALSVCAMCVELTELCISLIQFKKYVSTQVVSFLIG